MSIKLGGTEINAIAVSTPYGDDIRVIPDEAPSTWTRPSYWLDMPTIASGEHKCAFLMAVSSGHSLDNTVQITSYGIKIGSNYNTDFTLNWGDGTTFSHSEYHSQYALPPEATQAHDFDF